MTEESAFEQSWTLIVDPPLDGLLNMDLDGRMLAAVERSPGPLTILRFYSWARPTVSLGRNQKVDRAVDRSYCMSRGIDIVHRPTGGRAVLHDRELTYAIASNEAGRFGGRTIYETYRRISMALAEGYRRIGIDAVVAPDTTRPLGNGDRDPPCFVSPSRYELMVRGRKVSGSAQRRLRRGFLQHGSLPLVCDYRTAAGAFGVADPAALEVEMAGMADFLDGCPDTSGLAEAFTGAFGATFGVRFRLREGEVGRLRVEVDRNR
jgi:lipoate-protein ligase A